MSKGAAKLMELDRAVAGLVKPGMSIALGCALEGFIPFAAAHEVIRQGTRGLGLIGPISNLCFDQLIGAGLVEHIEAAWVGNVSTGSGYAFRRAAEAGKLTLVEHSNFSLYLALEAGARGLPMAVSRSPLGSSLAAENPHITPFTCPHSGEKLLAIKAIRPDVCILHVQQADPEGNCRAWGALGVSLAAAQAARQVLLTCEEVVPPSLIRSDPDRTLLPGFKVAAVCEVPFGAHPSPVQGYYGYDHAFHMDYAKATRDPGGVRAWLDEWVNGPADHRAYLAKLGPQRRRGLMLTHSTPAPMVEYGW